MKRFFIVLALLTVCCRLQAEAQILKVGVKGGINNHHTEFAALNFGDLYVAPSNGYQLGYQAGAVMRISIPHFLQIQPELVYSQTRTRLLITRSVTTASRMTFTTLDVPVMVGFNISSLRLFGGPVFRLSGDVKAPSNIYEISGVLDQDNIGVQAGVGLDVGKFFIDTRYSYYSDAFKYQLNINGITRTIRTSHDSSWIVNVGFFF